MNSKKNSSEIAEIRKDLIAVQRALVRIESAVMEIKTATTKRFRSESIDRISAPKRNSTSTGILHELPNQMVASTAATSSGIVAPMSTNHSRPSQRLRDIADRPPSQRLRDIADRPNPIRPCWFHRQFGNATDPAKCIAPCNFVRIPTIQAPLVPNAPAIVAPINISNPIIQAPLVPNAPAIVEEPMDDLEAELLNLSDTE